MCDCACGFGQHWECPTINPFGNTQKNEHLDSYATPTILVFGWYFSIFVFSGFYQKFKIIFCDSGCSRFFYFAVLLEFFGKISLRNVIFLSLDKSTRSKVPSNQCSDSVTVTERPPVKNAVNRPNCLKS